MKANGTLILSTYPCWSITQSSKLQMARLYVALCQGKTARSLSCLTLTLFVYSMEYRKKKNPPFCVAMDVQDMYCPPCFTSLLH